MNRSSARNARERSIQRFDAVLLRALREALHPRLVELDDVRTRGDACKTDRYVSFNHLLADDDKTINPAVCKAALASAQQQIKVLSAQRKEAQAKLGQAKAVLEQATVDLDKTAVKAPIDGAILKVNVRLGEYAQAGVLSDPLMTIGSIDPLHVRVDIDETETWRIRPGHAALARLRGNPEISTPLSFVRFEPYVLPKRSLTGDTTERVDTRVLQAIYTFDPGAFPAFVGQQVDVFIAAPSRAAATRKPTSGQIAFSPPAEAQMQIAGRASSTLLSPGADQPPN